MLLWKVHPLTFESTVWLLVRKREQTVDLEINFCAGVHVVLLTSFSIWNNKESHQFAMRFYLKVHLSILWFIIAWNLKLQVSYFGTGCMLVELILYLFAHFIPIVISLTVYLVISNRLAVWQLVEWLSHSFECVSLAVLVPFLHIWQYQMSR